MSELDALYLPVIIFVFFFCVAFMWLVTSAFIGDPVWAAYPEGQSVMQTAQTNAFTALDWGVIIVAGGWTLVGMILAFNSKAQPLYFVLYVFIEIAVIFIAPVMTNMASYALGVNNMANFETSFPIIVFVMENLPIITVVAVALIAIAQYSGMNLFGMGEQKSSNW